MNNSSLQTEYLNLDSSQSGFSKHNEKANSVKEKCTYFGLTNHSVEKCFKKIRKDKEKARSAGASSNKNSDCPPRKRFRCGSVDHIIAKCQKPPKDGEKKNGKKVSFQDKEKGNSAKDNSDDEDDLKVYASMARMSNDDVSEKKDYGDSPQLTSWILDSGATCHMTPEVTDFIPGSLEDTDKFIEVADGHHVTAKQKGSVRIQMFDDNGETFIATLYNVLLASDLCGILFSIITLMNAGHTCLFHKGFCTVYFGAKEDNAVPLPYSAVRKHAFMGKKKVWRVQRKIQKERKLL